MPRTTTHLASDVASTTNEGAVAHLPHAGGVSLKEQAYEHIKGLLFRTEPGSHHLSERQLAAQFNLGLGPIRAAIERLKVEGMVTVLPNAGIIVPELSARAILDFYEMRLTLESRVVEALASRPRNIPFEKLYSILNAQAECVEAGDPLAYYHADMELHWTLAELHGNREFVRSLSMLRDRMQRLAAKCHAGHPERMAPNFEEHRCIVDAIRVGDSAGAVRQLQLHLNGARNFILDPDARI